MIGQTVSHYRIIEKLGEGGMGEVYLAEDTKLHRRVALKFLPAHLTADREARERFEREAQAAAALNHPNIVTIHEINEFAGGTYMVMEYVEGSTLTDKIQSLGIPPVQQSVLDKLLPLGDVIDTTVQLGEGLARAHRAGIVHRDIKPGNILINKDGIVKILDFGIAKLKGTSKLTRELSTLGTIFYMSPEQTFGKEVDGRSDIWSVGVLLYEMLAGQLPFKGDYPQSVMYAIVNEEPEPLSAWRSDVPPLLEEVVKKALAKTPEKRYQTMEELLADLLPVREWLAEKSGRRLPGKTKFRRWLFSPVPWIALAVMALVAAALWLFHPSRSIPFSARDWILITDFDNQTGDTVFDRSLNTALTVSLQQSRYVNIFPHSRAQGTLQRMGKKTTDAVNEELGREIALREGIKVLVACSIGQVGQTYNLTASIIDPNTQVTLRTEAAQANGKDKILDVLNNLSKRIREDLGESLQSIKHQSLALPRVTTSSLEALKIYAVAGGFDDDKSIVNLQQAIGLDPNFALALARLGACYYMRNNRVQGEKYFQRALSLMDRITERERLAIEAQAAAFREKWDEAVVKYRIYVEKYPDDANGWFQLGYNCLRLRRHEDSIAAFTNCLKINPNEASAYVNIATCYNAMKKYPQSIDNYLKAFKLNPALLTFTNLNNEFGFMYAEMGEYQKARDVFEKMLSKGEEEKARGYRSLALLNMIQGKYSAAIQQLKESLMIYRALKSWTSELRGRLYLAVAYRAKGMGEAFTGEIRAARELVRSNPTEPWWLLLLGKICARLGMVQEANGLLKEIAGKMIQGNRADQAAYTILKGEIELSRANYAAAVDLFELACTLRDDGYPLESAAYGYYKKGEWAQAIAKYELVIEKKDFGWEAQEYWLTAHYMLGRIYEKKGETAKAIQNYQAFITMWKDADSDLIDLLDAKARLAKLAGKK